MSLSEYPVRPSLRKSMIPLFKRNQKTGDSESLQAMVHAQAKELQQGRDQTLQLEAILRGMAEGVLAVDPGGRVTYLNPRMEELFGLRSAEALGKPQMEVLRDAGLNQVLNAAMKGQDMAPKDLVFLRPIERIVQIRATPLPGMGRFGAVAVFLDVTRERRLEAMRSEFVANVSHELKTPLTAIRAALETLADGAVNDEEVRDDFLGKAIRHTDRLSCLIDDILCLSNIEEKQRRGWVEAEGRCLLFEAYQASLALVEQKAQHRKVAIQAQIIAAEAGMNISALTRALTNLLDNAVKYSPSGGQVRVRTSIEADALKIEVEDDGPGISAADQGRLFERFYRPDKARSRDMGGTGLGLSIVKHLLEGVGGRIGVVSEPGKGSCFWVHVPSSSLLES
jgi:two-component system phosphate regulon sensor histidine kinase PhoR